MRRPVGLNVDLGYEVEREPLPANDAAVGLDVGVNNRIATSDGEMVERREVDWARETRLHQAVSRKRRGGNRRRKAAATLARERHRSRVRNRNECHRITTDIVRRYGRIAVEKPTIPNMTRSASGTVEEPGTNVAAKSGLNREILTQTWGLIRSNSGTRQSGPGGSSRGQPALHQPRVLVVRPPDAAERVPDVPLRGLRDHV